uniref:Uncharacterized protein n=1 Tax=Trichuris muris TaxID=70415 RepID=A0A5S6QUC4_TRIMR
MLQQTERMFDWNNLREVELVPLAFRWPTMHSATCVYRLVRTISHLGAAENVASKSSVSACFVTACRKNSIA